MGGGSGEMVEVHCTLSALFKDEAYEATVLAISLLQFVLAQILYTKIAK